MSVIYYILRFLIALIWLVNGAWAKLAGGVPRHEEIVGRILGTDVAHPIIVTIGIGEVVMGIWIISGYQSRMNALIQVLVILMMNTIEFVFARDLLLWGQFNYVWAYLLCFIIIINEFRFKPTK